ncbi:MAG: DMT family protein [Candidatus Amulumruptor caecigallinarius]|nr:DMT family protein [Candidatus Amulumruptor caecigallinarius]
MKASLITVLLLVVSNIFMTFAWYGHLKLQSAGISKNWPLFVVILVSWGIAFLEYCVMIPANRIGFRENGGPFSLFQLKIIQEVITLTIFTIFALLLFKGEKLHWNHIAAFMCLLGAVAFTFLPNSN